MPLSEGHCTGVEPAVHNFRDSAHGLSANRALDVHFVYIRTMQFDGVIDIFDGLFCQFCSGTDGFQVTAFASPDVDGGTPVTVTGNCPVFDFSQPVAETAFADEFREPVDTVVIFHQLILQLGHFNVPGGLCIVDQRSTASPAVGIVVFHLFLCPDLVFSSQPLDDFHIQAVFHNEVTLPGSIGVLTFFIHRIDYRQVITTAGLIVVFPECRSGMNDTGTVFDGNIVSAGHEECLLIRLNEGHQLFVFHEFQVLTLHFFYDSVTFFTAFVGLAQDLVSQDLSHIVVFAVLLCLDVVHVRTYGQSNVGSQSPGSGGPSQEVFVVGTLLLELRGDGGNLDFLVALSYFVGSQTGTAARAVGQDLVAFIDHVSLEEFLQDPPTGFDIVIVQSDVGVVHIDQITHSLGHFSPHLFVSEYGFLTLFIEGTDTVSFDILLTGHL